LTTGVAGNGTPASSDGWPLAGGPVSFGQVAVIERAAGGRRILSTHSVHGALAQELPAETRAQLERLTAPRPDFAGLSMTRARVMGILNVTPDSFSDGGQVATPDALAGRAGAMLRDGVDLFDVGGESTRPGANPVPVAEEIARVVPAIAQLAGLGRPVSVDTRNAATMAAALDAGASIVNDVSALSHDPASLPLVARRRPFVVLMHALGDPRTMQDDPRYDDAPLDVFDALARRVAAAEAAGLPRERIAVDPGIGFGKTPANNLALVRDLALLHGLGVPVLFGASRKSFIARVAGEAPADRRLGGSIAAALAAAARGAQLLRVHDVQETRQALRIAAAIGT